MRVVSTFHQPSSVVSSAKCHLSDHELDHLVLAKTNRVEVHALTVNGLVFRTSLELWGYVIDVKPVKRPNGQCESIAVLTDHPDPRLILLDYILDSPTSTPSLSVVGVLPLFVKGLRKAEFIFTLAVTDDGKTALSAPYSSRILINSMGSKLSERIVESPDSNVRELNVLSIAFLPSDSSGVSTVAILHENHRSIVHLCGRDVDPESNDISLDYSQRLPDIQILDSFSDRIIPVPSGEKHPAGVLVVGGKSIYFYELLSVKGKQRAKTPTSPTKKTSPKSVPRSEIRWGYSNITAHELIDEDGSRILLGDKFGRLFVLAIEGSQSPNSPVDLSLTLIGETSPAHTLTYLNNGVVYVGSVNADNQLIQLSAERLSNDSHIKELDTFTNIAPIVDACLIDKDGSKELITASGTVGTGSLRIIRSGADFKQLVQMELLQEGQMQDTADVIRNLWRLKSSFHSKYDEYIVSSTYERTRVFRILNGPVAEDITTISGFRSDVHTLACGHICRFVKSDLPPADNTLVIQVTRESIRLIDIEDGMLVHELSAPVGAITTASLSPSQVCIATMGGRLYVYVLDDNQRLVVQNQHFFEDEDGPQEISAISCVPHTADKRSSYVFVIGFWLPSRVIVGVFDKGGNWKVRGDPINLSHVPLSMLLTTFGLPQMKGTYLLIGIGDGSVYYCTLDQHCAPSEGRNVNVGHTNVSLTRCKLNRPPGAVVDGENDGECEGVFACGDSVAIFFLDSGRVRHSFVALKGVASSSPFNSKEYPESLIFATPTNLVIGVVRDVQKLHIRTIPLGLDCPAQVCHNAELGVLGVGILRTERFFVGEPELISSAFDVYDDTSLQRIARYSFRAAEEVVSVANISLTCGGTTKNYFCAGTVFVLEQEVEPSHGLVHLFDVKQSGGGSSQSNFNNYTVSHATAMDVPGCVYSIVACNGMAIVAVNSSVFVLSLEESHRQLVLRKKAEINHNYLVKSLSIQDDMIFVGDLLNSISLFQLVGTELSYLAKCYTSHWPINMQTLALDVTIGADIYCNIFTYRYKSDGDKRQLESEAMYHFGEIISKFIPGTLSTLSTDDREQVHPEQLFFTSTGRIGIIAEFNESLSLTMTELQRNLASFVRNTGADHTEWRRPVNLNGTSDSQPQAVGFLDGDLLERYLSYSDEDVKKIRAGRNDAEALKLGHIDTVHVLERLQALH